MTPPNVLLSVLVPVSVNVLAAVPLTNARFVLIANALEPVEEPELSIVPLPVVPSRVITRVLNVSPPLAPTYCRAPATVVRPRFRAEALSGSFVVPRVPAETLIGPVMPASEPVNWSTPVPIFVVASPPSVTAEVICRPTVSPVVVTTLNVRAAPP